MGYFEIDFILADRMLKLDRIKLTNNLLDLVFSLITLHSYRCLKTFVEQLFGNLDYFYIFIYYLRALLPKENIKTYEK